MPGVEVTMENELRSLDSVPVHHWMPLDGSVSKPAPWHPRLQVRKCWAQLSNPLLAIVSLGRITYLPIPALWHGQDKGKRVAVLSHLYKSRAKPCPCCPGPKDAGMSCILRTWPRRWQPQIILVSSRKVFCAGTWTFLTFSA